MNISYLGPKGTFTEIALNTYFQKKHHKVVKQSINDVFKSVDDKEANYGVVPVENSIEGAVNNTLDQLMENDVYIIGEITIPINQCLLSKSTNKNNIKNLFSHPQSLAQCRKWINNNTPNSKLIPMLSNSEGAIQVKTNNDACIGPNTLSDYYDLTLVESNIQDFENNQTRFLILGKSIHYSLNESKTSIIIIPQTESRSGSLYNLLKPFSDNNVNLTRIESRPLKTHNWKYSFFIDFEGSYKDKNVINAIDTIKNNNNELKFLGSYKPSL